MEKATFIAQISAPIALVLSTALSAAAVYFSKESLREQRDFFVLQNRPKVEWTDIVLGEEGHFIGLFNNYGATEARNICFNLSHSYLVVDENKLEPVSEIVASNCDDRELNGNFNILGDSQKYSLLMQTGNQIYDFGFAPKAFVSGQAETRSFGGTIVFGLLSYEDVYGNRYSSTTSFSVLPANSGEEIEAPAIVE